MTQTFKDTLATLETSKNLEVGNQAFANEISFDQDLSISVFWDLKFSNFNFSKVNFSGSYFTDCKFENCTFDKTILRKCEFTDSIFKNCNRRNSSLAVSLEKRSLMMLISKSNLEIKDLTVLNLNFTDTFPTKF